MVSTLNKAKAYFRKHPAKLFLLDGCGALLSGMLLMLVLVKLNSYIGMPLELVWILILPILFFCVYSLTCAFRTPGSWKPYLRFIAYANLSYCILTFSLILYYFEELTLWGILYFLIEIAIVVSLALFEIWVTK